MNTNDILEDVAVISQPAISQKPDHEVQMARSELYRAGKAAIELHNMLKNISEQQGLEGWVQAKITKAADYLESVYHYLDYETKSGVMREGAPTGATGPIAPGAVPVGGTAGVSVSPAQASAMAAKASIDKKKAIEAEIRKLDVQKAQLQRQLAVPATVQETTSAGSIASVVGANGMGKSKKEVGSLFGGSYNQKKEDIAEIKKGEKDSNGYTKCWPGKHAEGTKKGKNGGQVRNCVPNESVSEGEAGPKFTGYWKGKDKGKPGKKMVGSSS